MRYIYRTIARIVPLWIKKRINAFLSYTSIEVEHENFIGFVTLSSLLIGAVAGLFLGYLLRLPFWIFFLSFMLLSNIIIYLWLVLSVDKKARLVEESLPDALRLMASNLRAGMTPEKALLLSSRPEFGPLKYEIDIVGRKVTLGKNVGTALLEMSTRVRSKRLARAVELINSGLESGGSLATLLDATSHDIQEQFLVDKKIKASITMYVIFIFAAAALISPVLFGLSSFLIDVLRSSLTAVEIPATAVSSLPIKAVSVAIGSRFLLSFIIVFLVVNSFMASLLLGLIVKGRQREGFRYFFPMVALAIPLFLLSRYAIKTLLSGLFSF